MTNPIRYEVVTIPVITVPLSMANDPKHSIVMQMCGECKALILPTPDGLGAATHTAWHRKLETASDNALTAIVRTQQAEMASQAANKAIPRKKRTEVVR